MFDTLDEKLDYEWSKWENYLYIQSNAECISRSYEITVKRLIYRFLVENSDTFNDYQSNFLMHKTNVIDYIYSKCLDKGVIAIEDGALTKSVTDKIIETGIS